MPTGMSCTYVAGDGHVPLPPSIPAHDLAARKHAPVVKRPGLDWAALRPTCTGCGEKSSEVTSAGLCRTCLDPQPVAAAPAQGKAARAPRRPSAKTAANAAARAERNAKIAAAYQAGQTAPAIAAEHGLTHPTVYEVLRRAGVPIRSDHDRQRGLPAETQAKLVADYGAGATVPELAEKYGIVRITVRRILDRNGVERRDERLASPGRLRAFNPEGVREVCRLYVDEQLTRTAVAERLHMSFQTVCTILEQEGVQVRQGQRRRPAADLARPLRDRLAELDVTPREVKAWAIREGLLLEVKVGMPPKRVVEAYAAAHARPE